MAIPTNFSATIHDYFKHEFENTLRAESPLLAKTGDGPFVTVTRKVYLDIHTNAKYASFYIPPCDDMVQTCVALAQRPDLALSADENVQTFFATPTTPMRSTQSLVFTNKTILYADAYLTNEERDQVLQAGQQKELDTGEDSEQNGMRFPRNRMGLC